MKNVLVRIGGKDYSIPHNDRHGKLLIVTDNPGKGGVLVWRMKGLEGLGRIAVREGSLAEGRISEGNYDAAVAHWYVNRKERSADVWHFLVHEGLRRKTVGSALREVLLRHLRDSGVGEVSFPMHAEREFYEKRGFVAKAKPSIGGSQRTGYAGTLKGLGAAPKGIKLKVLWKKARPRFAK